MKFKTNCRQILHIIPYIIMYGLTMFNNPQIKAKNSPNNSNLVLIDSVEKDTIDLTNFKILNFCKKYDTSSIFFTEYKYQCDDWTLDETEIYNIILESKKIDGFDYNQFFAVLPCFYEGILVLKNNQEYVFRINAGSSITIINNNYGIYLGYYGDKGYFLERAAKPSDF